MNEKIEALQIAAESCRVCGLEQTRSSVVIGRGNWEAKIMIIGEAPGVNEDKLGIPFCGRAGKKLFSILRRNGVSPDTDCFITNTVQCWPKNTDLHAIGRNRKPTDREVNCCNHFLHAKIRIVKPELILCVGATAASVLLYNTTSSQTMKFFRKNSPYIIFPELTERGIAVYCTYHPAYLLRNPAAEELLENDLKAALAVVKQLKEPQQFLAGSAENSSTQN